MGRALFVANAGGHLKELLHLSERLPFPVDGALWVTFDGAQSRSLLAGRDVRYVRYSAPRDGTATLVNAVAAAQILWRGGFSWAFSTGATVAVSFLPLARARGIASYYLESATRVSAPSLTGRILSRVPGVRTYAQYPGWSVPGWRYCGSVFDGFRADPAGGSGRIRRVVVTVGASETYGFRRLVDALLPLLPAGAEVLWQIGRTDVAGLGIEGRRQVPALELEAAMRDADLVVAHAGVGSALTALECGKVPVLVPREATHGEHVDDHQFQIAAELARRDLAVASPAGSLGAADLERAARAAVHEVPDPPLLDLAGDEVGAQRPRSA